MASLASVAGVILAGREFEADDDRWRKRLGGGMGGGSMDWWGEGLMDGRIAFRSAVGTFGSGVSVGLGAAWSEFGSGWFGSVDFLLLGGRVVLGMLSTLPGVGFLIFSMDWWSWLMVFSSVGFPEKQENEP